MSRRSWWLFAAMCVIWGLPYLLIRVAVDEVSPPVLVFVRTGLGALLLLPVALRRKAVRPALTRWRPLLAYTVAELAIPWLLLSDAERHISSSLAGLLVAAVPLAGIALAFLLRSGEVLTPVRVLGLLAGIAGVAALLGLDLGALDARALVEVAFVVVGYALGPAILVRSLSDVPGIGVVVTSLAITAIGYLPFAIAARPAHVRLTVGAALVALAVICTGLAFVVFFELIAAIGPARALVITYVNPAVAVLLGVAFLGERFTAGMAIGFPLILLGSVLAARSPRSPSSPAVPEATTSAPA